MPDTAIRRKEDVAVVAPQYKDLLHGYLASTTSVIATLLAEASSSKHERLREWYDFQDTCHVLQSRLRDLRKAVNPANDNGKRARHLLDDVIDAQLWKLPDDFSRAGLATDRPGLPIDEARQYKRVYVERLKTILRALDMV